MFLLSNSPTVEFLPLVESAFALGQKRFRPWSKALSPLVKSAFALGQKRFRPWSKALSTKGKNLFDQGRKVKKW